MQKRVWSWAFPSAPWVGEPNTDMLFPYILLLFTLKKPTQLDCNIVEEHSVPEPNSYLWLFSKINSKWCQFMFLNSVFFGRVVYLDCILLLLYEDSDQSKSLKRMARITYFTVLLSLPSLPLFLYFL